MNFYYKELNLGVPDSIYYPSEDSILLAETLEKKELKNKKCLDMGCGSGFLSIIMAKKGAKVISADISKDSIKTTKENATKNNVKIKTLQSDLFSAIKMGVNVIRRCGTNCTVGSALVPLKFDFIVFNSPYLPVKKSEKESEQWSGGRKSGIIKKFIKQAKNFLEPNGRILLLISSLTGEKDIIKAFHTNGFSTNISARKKIFFEELMVIGAKRKAKNQSLRFGYLRG